MADAAYQEGATTSRAGDWQTERVSTGGFPYDDLGDFLAALERAGELHRISAPVDPTLEMSEIGRASCRERV